MFTTNYTAGGRLDSPHYPTFQIPYLAGLHEETQGGKTLLRYVVPFWGECFAISLDCSEYKNDDYWNLIIDGEMICEKIYVKRAPEGINFMAFIPVAPGQIIDIEFLSDGRPKSVWASLHFLKEGDMTPELPTLPPGIPDTDLPIIGCGIAAEGGSNSAENYHNLGSQPGKVKISYDFYSAEDTMKVCYKNNVLHDTGITTGVGEFTINYNPDPDEFVIRVVMNDGGNGSAWEYLVNCPVPDPTQPPVEPPTTLPPGGHPPVGVTKGVVRLYVFDWGQIDKDIMNIYLNGALVKKNWSLVAEVAGDGVLGTNYLELPLRLGDNEIIFEGVSPGDWANNEKGNHLTARMKMKDTAGTTMYDPTKLPDLVMNEDLKNMNGRFYINKPKQRWIITRTI